MPLQHLFTKRDQRAVPSAPEEALARAGDFLRQTQFHVELVSPTRLHAEQYQQKLGLRRVMDLYTERSPGGTLVTAELSATLGDEAAALGIAGALLIFPLTAAVGVLSYVDYESDANSLLSSLWGHLSFTASGDMPRCTDCGLEAGPGDRFCRQCGGQVTV